MKCDINGLLEHYLLKGSLNGAYNALRVSTLDPVQSDGEGGLSSGAAEAGAWGVAEPGVGLDEGAEEGGAGARHQQLGEDRQKPRVQHVAGGSQEVAGGYDCLLGWVGGHGVRGRVYPLSSLLLPPVTLSAYKQERGWTYLGCSGISILASLLRNLLISALILSRCSRTGMSP